MCLLKTHHSRCSGGNSGVDGGSNATADAAYFSTNAGARDAIHHASRRGRDEALTIARIVAENFKYSTHGPSTKPQNQDEES
jgi:hypothetical protein